MENFKYFAVVIEPNLSERLVLKERLSVAGISVVAFDGISEALEHVAAVAIIPDIIFVSAHYGRTALDELMFFVRADAELKTAQIILMARNLAAIDKLGGVDASAVLLQPLQDSDLSALLKQFEVL